jgi:hypothetical protein
MSSPRRAAASAVATVVGNSARLQPSARNQSRCSGLVSSWDSSGTPLALPAAASRAIEAGISPALALVRSTKARKSPLAIPQRSIICASLCARSGASTVLVM